MTLDEQVSRTNIERLGIGSGLLIGLTGAVAARWYPIAGEFFALGGCVTAIASTLPYCYRIQRVSYGSEGSHNG